jgi:integrase
MIIRRPDSKYYWFRFMYKGKLYQEPTGVKNKEDAKDIEGAFRTALAKGDMGIVERKTVPGFKTAMQAFLDWSKHEHAAHPETYRRYRVSSVALLRHFVDVSLDKITADEVERFKAERRSQFVTVRGQNGQRKKTKKRIKPASINRELACLRAMFNHVIKGKVPVENPVSKVGAKLLQEDNEQMRILTFDEQTKYLAKATPMLWDVATLMLSTGLRPEEVYRIQPGNVHLTESYLFNPFGKTKAARRRVPLNSTARSVLARRMQDFEAPFLFPCDTDPDRPVPKMNNAHDRAVKASGIAHFRLYDLRHTWATRAAQSGVDLVTLAALLGHARIQMVLRYVHPTQEHQTKAMEKMERYVAEQQIAELSAKQGRAEGMIQ